MKKHLQFNQVELEPVCKDYLLNSVIFNIHNLQVDF